MVQNLRNTAAAVLLAAAALIILMATPVLATDNVTQVVTDNFTITIKGPISIEASANTTSLIQALTDVAVASTANQQAISNRYFELVLVLSILALALWRKEIVLDTASGLILIFAGFSWVGDFGGISVVIMVLGCYQLFNALSTALTSKGPVQGLSQFKNIYHRIRGR